MNILFISLVDLSSVEEPGIYTDLLRCMRDEGHSVCVLSPVERSSGRPSHVVRDGRTLIVKPRIGNVQQTSAIEKGLSTVLPGAQLRRPIKRELSGVRFDLVLYPTPPITFLKAVRYVKGRDGAKAYLMLKDIFPQKGLPHAKGHIPAERCRPGDDGQNRTQVRAVQALPQVGTSNEYLILARRRNRSITNKSGIYSQLIIQVKHGIESESADEGICNNCDR